MIIHDYKIFLSLIAKKCNLLVFDDGLLLKEHKELLELFASYHYNSINEASVAALSNILITMSVDIVVICVQSAQVALSICKHVSSYDDTIAITVAFKYDNNELSQQISYTADTIVLLPSPSEVLYKKLSSALSVKLLMQEFSHTLHTDKKFLDETGVDSFRDAYEDEMKIISEFLYAYVQRLEAGELNSELFYDIADKIEDTGEIFTYHHYTAHIKSIFDELAAFLRTYGFENVDVSTLEGFDYLIAILQDVRAYIENFFVQRVFSDVYVFEHSLHDSIRFMIRRLMHIKDKPSEVEFF